MWIPIKKLNRDVSLSVIISGWNPDTEFAKQWEEYQKLNPVERIKQCAVMSFKDLFAKKRLDRDGQISRLGRYWWMWVPNFHHNGGSFSRKETVDMCAQWCCVSLDFTAYYTGSN